MYSKNFQVTSFTAVHRFAYHGDQRPLERAIRQMKRSDILSPEERSRRMRSVRRSCTADEELLFNALVSVGFVPTRNDPSLPGTPDMVFREFKLAIFVDGDFWHGREWFTSGKAPKGNRRFWVARFESNRRRDRRCERALRRMGWRVSRAWGSAVRKAPSVVAKRIIRRVKLGGHRDV